MKSIFFMLSLIALTSCGSEQVHNYSIQVSYTNGQQDTVSFVAVCKGSPYGNIELTIDNHGCLVEGNGSYSKVLVCGARSFKILTHKITEVK